MLVAGVAGVALHVLEGDGALRLGLPVKTLHPLGKILILHRIMLRHRDVRGVLRVVVDERGRGLRARRLGAEPQEGLPDGRQLACVVRADLGAQPEIRRPVHKDWPKQLAAHLLLHSRRHRTRSRRGRSVVGRSAENGHPPAGLRVGGAVPVARAGAVRVDVPSCRVIPRTRHGAQACRGGRAAAEGKLGLCPLRRRPRTHALRMEPLAEGLQRGARALDPGALLEDPVAVDRLLAQDLLVGPAAMLAEGQDGAATGEVLGIHG
mmetsp:Transcript_160914/g.516436  ORF Transcript_160914/g.516436 Transcript_160914/m.516436 type:complete len:264 (-) Transcript_160914:606-1397(-)